jgi:hypothetical protein
MDSLKMLRTVGKSRGKRLARLHTALTHFFNLPTTINHHRKFERCGINKARPCRYK